MALSVSGLEEPVPIRQPSSIGVDGETLLLNVTARAGNSDGANLPWFQYADAILLTWTIERHSIEFPVKVRWTATENEQTMELQTMNSKSLLAIQTDGDRAATLAAVIPPPPHSVSPSVTYPIRAEIIKVLAPSIIFINDMFGDRLLALLQSIVPISIIGFIVFRIRKYQMCARGLPVPSAGPSLAHFEEQPEVSDRVAARPDQVDIEKNVS